MQEDDVIAQIETDKVTIDVKFTGKSGRISTLLVAEGDTVVVGQAVASVEEGDFGSSSSSAPAAAAEEEAPAAAAAPPKPAAAAAPKPAAAAPPPPPKPAVQQQVRHVASTLRFAVPLLYATCQLQDACHMHVVLVAPCIIEATLYARLLAVCARAHA